MQIRTSRRQETGIHLQMTAMIDIVFQLLVFFIMTFNVVQAEGAFSLLMPGQPAEGTRIDQVPPRTLRVRMTSDSQGNLTTLTLNEEQLGTADAAPFADLHRRVRDLVTHSAALEDSADHEVIIKCDHALRYENVIRAIGAVNGYRVPGSDEQNIVTLIDKIRFAKPVPVTVTID